MTWRAALGLMKALGSFLSFGVYVSKIQSSLVARIPFLQLHLHSSIRKRSKGVAVFELVKAKTTGLM